MTSNLLYFEVTDNINCIRLEIVTSPIKNTELGSENNWLKSLVKFNIGAFSGEYFADFQTFDFELFRKELEIAYKNLNRNAMFDGVESQAKIHLNGEGTGHFEVSFSLIDKPGFGNELRGEFTIDQTQLPEIINQLKQININFPSIS